MGELEPDGLAVLPSSLPLKLPVPLQLPVHKAQFHLQKLLSTYSSKPPRERPLVKAEAEVVPGHAQGQLGVGIVKVRRGPVFVGSYLPASFLYLQSFLLPPAVAPPQVHIGSPEGKGKAHRCVIFLQPGYLRQVFYIIISRIGRKKERTALAAEAQPPQILIPS